MRRPCPARQGKGRAAPAIPIARPATAPGRRETGISLRSPTGVIRAVAIRHRAIAADSREMTTDTQETAIYRPRNAAATVETAARSGADDCKHR